MSRPNTVHSFPHDAVNCKRHCNRRLECGHPCTELCHLPCKSDCACDQESEPLGHAVTFQNSSKETHLAPLIPYAESATASSQKNPNPYGPQTGSANHTPPLNESPEQQKTKLTLRAPSQISSPPQPDDRPTPNHDIDLARATQPFRDYAEGGHVASDRTLAALAEREAAEARGRRLDEESFDLLFRNDPADGVVVDGNEAVRLIRPVGGGGGGRGVWKGTWSADAGSGRKEEASLLD